MSTVPTDVSSLGPLLSVILLNNEYNNDNVSGIKQDDLANFMGSLGSQSVIAAYLKRIDSAILTTTFADISTGANSYTSNVSITTDTQAADTFKTYMTWYVITKAFNSGYIALDPATGISVLTAQELELNKRMLYVAQKGYGNSWFNAISSKVFPKFNFKVAYTAAVGYVVSEVVSTATGYAAASFFEISPNSMTSFSAMAPVIRANNGSNVLSVSDLPSSGVSVKGAMMLVLNKTENDDQSTVTVADLKTVLPLVNSTSSNLLNDLNGSTDGSNILKTIIGQMTDPRLLYSFANMIGNDLLYYVPASITPVVQRSQYDSSDVTKIFEYSNAVSRVDALVKLGGWSYERILGIYLANNPSGSTDNTVLSLLNSEGAPAEYTPWDGLGSAGTPVQTRDVFAAYRHYLQPSKFAYASLQTSAQIANWISESGISALLTTTPANTNNNISGVNAGANTYISILNAFSTADKPSSKLDVHFDAIKILAQQVSNNSTNNAAGKSVADIVNLWFTTTPDTSDKPDGADATDFWKLPDSSSIESAELKFALYVLGSGFKMLSDPSNDKWFAKLVKVGAVVSGDAQTNGSKNLYGLSITVLATGKPTGDFGSADQILRAVNGISANESSFTKVKLYLTVMSDVTSFAEIEKLYGIFGESVIVNLSSIPQDKSNNVLISCSSLKMAKVFPQGISPDFYAGFTSNTDSHKNLVKRMAFVSTVHDLITAVTPVNKTVVSINHLKLFNATDSGDFFKYHVPYENGVSGDATANAAFNNIINIIMEQDSLKINPFITANSRAVDWSEAIVNHMRTNPVCLRDILDAIDTTSTDVLKPSESVKLKSIATSVKTLLEKPLYINPDDQAAETRITLSDLIADTSATPTLSGKQGNIIFTWYGAISDGGLDMTKLTQDAYNNLLVSGMSNSDILNSVYSRPIVVGFQVGGISFSTFVGTDENGNPIFDSV